MNRKSNLLAPLIINVFSSKFPIKSDIIVEDAALASLSLGRHVTANNFRDMYNKISIPKDTRVKLGCLWQIPFYFGLILVN